MNTAANMQCVRISQPRAASPQVPMLATLSAALPDVPRLLRQSAGRGGMTPTGVDQTLASSGSPLEPALRLDMEQRFAHDFSQVRIHTDAQAAQSARNVSARAYTVGQHVVFGAGEFAPDTRRGRQLLGHELAHTVQQGGTLARVPLIAHLAPGSPLESAAAAAGRAVVNGGAVTQPLGRSGIVLARELIGNENQWVPQALRDQEKIKQFWQLWARYRKRDIQPWEYPQRALDKKRIEALATEASALMKARQAAVAEAEAVVANMGRDDDVEAEEAAVVKIAERATDPKFTPGGYTDEMVHAEYNAAQERIERETAPAKDPRHFKDRLKEARKKAPLALLKSDYYRSIWEYGLSNGLFAERERGLVFDELRAPARERAAQERKQAEVRQYNEQIQRFRSFRSQLNLGFIQGALLGRPGVPMYLRGPYTSFGVAHTGIETYRGIQSGDPTRVVGATLPLVTGMALHRVIGAGKQPTPGKSYGGPRQQGRGRPEEIYDYDVRTAYNTDPASVKKMASNSWAQYVWEMHGGEGIHPMAWRHPGGRVIYVNEARWTGRLAEINQPHELGPPGRVPLAYSPTLPDPRAPTALPPPVEPVGPGTQPSTPPARPRAAPGAAPARPARAPSTHGRPHAVQATEQDALAAYQSNPKLVYGSPSSDWHMQIWYMNQGRGAPPIVYRSGNAILVDVQRAPRALLDALGMGMRLP